MMVPSSAQPPRILPAVRRYWSDHVSRVGVLRTTRDLLAAFCGFLRDSTPARLKSRFGDADYDWDYRVNTTSGAVGWRERLLGMFHSSYQPTEPGLFHQMIDALRQQTNLNLEEFTFIDLGSGKGRAVLMASDYPFLSIVGVELLPALHETARQNLVQYKSESQKCFQVEAICGDAADFRFPEGQLVVYLFNPFPESGMRRVLANLARSLEAVPRAAYVLYHNPQLEHVLINHGRWSKVAYTHQYSIFAAQI